MKSVAIYISVLVIIGLSILIGSRVVPPTQTQKGKPLENIADEIPSFGSVEVLNGCGITGAASAVAEFLRKNGFDVKNTENAKTWNYPVTTVVSRKKDMGLSKKIASVLKTDKIILMRIENSIYDVTVFVGSDFGDLIDE